jgi:hypothetical protein
MLLSQIYWHGSRARGDSKQANATNHSHLTSRFSLRKNITTFCVDLMLLDIPNLGDRLPTRKPAHDPVESV